MFAAGMPNAKAFWQVGKNKTITPLSHRALCPLFFEEIQSNCEMFYVRRV